MGVTEDDLVVDALGAELEQAKHWYLSKEGSEFMAATDSGRLAFTWEATYENGDKIRQYDSITFLRCLTDRSYIPPIERIISTDFIDRSYCVKFILYPIAYTKDKHPKLKNSFQVLINPKLGEELVAHWLTDVNVTTGQEIRRHVIGCKVDSLKFVSLVIISPSGSIMISSTEDNSFEGE